MLLVLGMHRRNESHGGKRVRGEARCVAQQRQQLESERTDARIDQVGSSSRMFRMYRRDGVAMAQGRRVRGEACWWREARREAAHGEQEEDARHRRRSEGMGKGDPGGGYPTG